MKAKQVFERYESLADQAYKGYMMSMNCLQNLVRIHKGGFHIAYVQTWTEARNTIDLLTGE